MKLSNMMKQFKAKLTDKTKRIIFVFLMVFSLFFLCLFPTDVEVITPGALNKVNNLYKMENENDNEFYQTAVYAFRRPNFIMRSFLELSSKNKTRRIDVSNLSNSEDLKMAEIDGVVSSKSAIVAAYNLAIKKGYDVKLEYDITSFYIYYTSPNLRSKLKIGTMFNKINGKAITKDFYLNDLKDELKKDIVLENEKGKVTISKKELSSSKLYLKPNIKITKTSPKIKISGNTGYGPSAGMINAVNIYYNLINKKINHKIAGTGTINLKGDVGAIGGIVQKIYTTNKYKMDYFLIPRENYDVAYDEIESVKRKVSVKVVVVNDLEDAINKLGDIKWKSLKH